MAGPYCPACGQDGSTSRLNVRQSLSSAAGHLFNMDAVVPRTFIDLWRNPGRVAREYVDGRRVTYVQPFRYCLTAVALMMLVYAIVGRDPKTFLYETDVTFTPAMLKFQAETMAFVLRHLNVVIFAALPLQALVLKGLFRRSRFNYAEVLSFTLYVMGQSFLISAVLAAVYISVSELQFFLRLGVQLIYLVYASIGFFDEHRVLTVFKCLMATFLNMVIVAILVIILLTPRFVTLIKELKAEKAQAPSETVESGTQNSQLIL